MKKYGLLMGVLCLISIISFVNAQPPQTNINLQEGLDISYPKFDAVKINEPFNLSIHVYNISNQLSLNSADCRLELYNQTGHHIINDADLTVGDDEYYYFIAKGNFSERAVYSYNIYCNDTNIGGFIDGTITVNRGGVILDTSESLIYLLLTLGVFLIFGLSLYAMLSIPYSNKTNNKGAIIKITKAKYFKLLMIGVTYAFFVWLLNILIGVSDNYAGLTLYYGFISFLFTILINLTLPVFVIIFVVALFELVRDSNIYGNIKKFGESMR